MNSVDACYRELVAGEVRIKSANQVVARSAPGQSLSFSRICTVEASSTLPTSKGECGGRRAHHLIYVQPAPRRAIMASQGQLSSAEAIFHPSRLAYGLTPTLFTLKTYVLIVRHLWHRTHVLFGARFQAECHACSPTTRAGPPGAPPRPCAGGPSPGASPALAPEMTAPLLCWPVPHRGPPQNAVPRRLPTTQPLRVRQRPTETAPRPSAMLSPQRAAARRSYSAGLRPIKDR